MELSPAGIYHIKCGRNSPKFSLNPKKFSSGNRRRGRNERLQEVEGSRRRHERVTKLDATSLPTNPDIHQCREELHHHLPPAHRHAHKFHEEISCW